MALILVQICDSRRHRTYQKSSIQPTHRTSMKSIPSASKTPINSTRSATIRRFHFMDSMDSPIADSSLTTKAIRSAAIKMARCMCELPANQQMDNFVENFQKDKYSKLNKENGQFFARSHELNKKCHLSATFLMCTFLIVYVELSDFNHNKNRRFTCERNG